MLSLFETKSFKKDRKKLSQSQKLKLLDVVETLLAEEQLNSQYRDHSLQGNFKGCRECHVEPDLLLVYEVIENELILHHISSHSELF